MSDKDKQQFTVDLSGDTPIYVPRNQKPKKPGQPPWAMLVYAGQIGTSIIVPLLIGVGLGRYADVQNNSHPTWVLVGLGAGFFLSLVSLITTVKEILRKLQ